MLSHSGIYIYIYIDTHIYVFTYVTLNTHWIIDTCFKMFVSF